MLEVAASDRPRVSKLRPQVRAEAFSRVSGCPSNFQADADLVYRVFWVAFAWLEIGFAGCGVSNGWWVHCCASNGLRVGLSLMGYGVGCWGFQWVGNT